MRDYGMNGRLIFQQVVLGLLLAMLITVIVIGVWPETTIEQPPGILGKNSPKIVRRAAYEPIVREPYEYYSLGAIRFTSRILAKQRYYYLFGMNTLSFDRTAEFAPYDLLIGWREMSDEETLADFRFYIDNREYTWKPKDINDRPKVTKLVEMNTALVHIIPGNAANQAILDEICSGHIVFLDGVVVKVKSTVSNYSWGNLNIDVGVPKPTYTVLVNEVRIVQ
jgi:hypothetical protein